MGTHVKVLSESYPMLTKMTGFKWFSKIFAIIALALEVLTGKSSSVI